VKGVDAHPDEERSPKEEVLNGSTIFAEGCKKEFLGR